MLGYLDKFYSGQEERDLAIRRRLESASAKPGVLLLTSFAPGRSSSADLLDLITALSSFEAILSFMNIDYTVIDCSPHRGISLTGRFVCLHMLCFPEYFLVFEQKFTAEVK